MPDVLPLQPVETFSKFTAISSHTVEDITNIVLDFLEENRTDVKSCRGESCNNACLANIKVFKQN